MDVAVVGAVAAVLGALIGAVVATINARRHERLQVELARAEADRARNEQLSSIALAMAKAEIERDPANPHSLPAHFKVLETLLHHYDDPARAGDLDAVRDQLDGQYAGLCRSVGANVIELEIARSIGEKYCAMCGARTRQGTCPNCGPTVDEQGLSPQRPR